MMKIQILNKLYSYTHNLVSPLTLRFQKAILSFQVIDILLMWGILSTHKLYILCSLFKDLRSASNLFTLQRWYRISQAWETVFNMISTFSFQGIVMSSFFSLKELHKLVILTEIYYFENKRMINTHLREILLVIRMPLPRIWIITLL